MDVRRQHYFRTVVLNDKGDVMTKEEQQELVNEIGEMDRRLKQIADQVIHSELEIPVSNQVWKFSRLAGSDGWDIFNDGNYIAKAFTPEIRDIILGIPALVKACKEHCAAPAGSGSDLIRRALKAMGVE
jgi:hypothetical protein